MALISWPWRRRSSETVSLGRLRTYNFVAAGLYAAQGFLILILSSSNKGIAPVTTNYLGTDSLSSISAGRPVVVPATHHLFDLNLVYLVATFLFMTALFHLGYATVYRRRYDNGLTERVSGIHWLEYAVSVGLMLVLIAILSGIFDLSTLLMIFGLVGLMSLMGLAMEAGNRSKKHINWFSYKVGILAGLIPWLVVVVYALGVHVYSRNLPVYVYWIYLSLFALLAAVVINRYLQFRKIGHWESYLFGEKVYIILSLIATGALSWQIFFGTLR